MGMELVDLANFLDFFGPSEREWRGIGVLGENEGEKTRLGTGEQKDLIGVGSKPEPDWKVRQLIPLKSLDGGESNDPNRSGPWPLLVL